MAPADLQDNRLQQRAARSDQASRAKTEAAILAQPDMADNVQTPSAEDLEKLREELAAEQQARQERIERFAEERKAPPPPRPPVQPLSEAEI